MATPANPGPAGRRYVTPRTTLVIDRLMGRFISVGGVAIIIAVFGIFFFILGQVLPLFQRAGIVAEGMVATLAEPRPALALMVDEWGDLPVVLDDRSRLTPMARGATLPAAAGPALLGDGARLTAACARPTSGELAMGTADGCLAVARLEWSRDAGRRISLKTAMSCSAALAPGQELAQVAFGHDAGTALAAAIVRGPEGPRLAVQVLEEEDGRWGGGRAIDAAGLVAGRPERILVDERGEGLLVATAAGDIHWLRLVDGRLELAQAPFRPFADLPEPVPATMDYVLGDVSVVFTHPSGVCRTWAVSLNAKAERREYMETKRFPDLPGRATAFAHGTRNKAFALAAGGDLSLRYNTTAAVSWEGRAGCEPRHLAFNGKYDRILAADGQGSLHSWSLRDPHPEAGLGAFFGRIWYEGGKGPAWDWQSSGGSNDFEPSLSLVPLIFGTLKGTIYAMLFATPVALLAAIYVAEFMHPRFKTVVKPGIELMASLPSVVLGFLAALWLAPLLETRVPAVLMAALAVPAAALAAGAAWTRLPPAWRVRLPAGREFLALIPILALAGLLGWQLGGPVERLCFGGDFRQWWPKVAGPFEQRNSLVVGFIMGFAVIPIVFTIVEDALSNVPKSLRSASLALGASRWQTAMRVVVPTASAGILSALMIGFGRAIGETMIVVMATGNTPILDWNIFNGLRTLSANIAVELPEAPHSGTLYRTLFLGALLLFVLTFVINTAAEVLRQYLRDKYKTV